MTDGALDRLQRIYTAAYAAHIRNGIGGAEAAEAARAACDDFTAYVAEERAKLNARAAARGWPQR